MPLTKVSRVSNRGGVTKTTPVKPILPPQGQSPLKKPLRKSESTRAQDFEKETTPRANKYGTHAEAVGQSNCKTGRRGTSITPQKKRGEDVEGKRMRRYRSKPPASFLVKLERAQTQRMIVLGRKRSMRAGAPSEDIDIVGSTGNIYTVTVSHLPTCTCPDSLKGNECKHKVYALHTVLKAPLHLQYQLALLTPELDEIFAHAPPIPTDLSEDAKGSRKPTDGECPICYMELDEEHNELVWCKVQCGHNLHKSCFNQWAKSQAGKGVRCVYCRTSWETDVSDVEAIKRTAEYTQDGYVNVADHFGISRAREYSGYYQPWVRRRFGQQW
ncbi:uncharacterized protein PV07_06394 [Cladophialophora immunda]|uniref:Anaphase-promoting complex subunit 11 n=1 Tax=Cladophialophora immunda TaxID=569365 RepID=A0A0D2CKT0_9EURO|nr:uncharacterized protein PV07_06394 [Cladophialophora immunda]KIW30670.1 hypothetical protein PV07_06394 [Cladophialophora immunda]OQU99494.1 Ring finger domain-containing protein [Cladophialophora immunda]